MAALDASSSQLLKTAHETIAAYNAWDLEKIMAVRAPDCIHQVLPRSLGRPELPNDQFRAYFGGMMPHFRNFHVTINDIFEDPKRNKVNIWASSTAETDVGPYKNEYMLVLHMNKDGTKLTKFYEFVDSYNSVVFFPKLSEHIEKLAKEKVEEA